MRYIVSDDGKSALIAMPDEKIIVTQTESGLEVRSVSGAVVVDWLVAQVRKRRTQNAL